MNTFLKWISDSSENPAKASMTLRGILLLFVGGILNLAQQHGVSVTETQLVEGITTLCNFFGALLALVGLLRKLYNELKKKIPNIRSLYKIKL